MFTPDLKIGQTITDKEIGEKFQHLQPTLGIRYHKNLDLVVLINNETKENKYPDEWVGNTLYYSGTDANMDKATGEQRLDGSGNNNRHLYSMWFDKDCKTQLFLFVKKAVNVYEYKGPARICAEPFKEARRGGEKGFVWKFPVSLETQTDEKIENDFEELEYEHLEFSLEDLRAKAKEKQKKQSQGKPITRTVTYSTCDRESIYSALVKKRADGKCDLCGQKAPFLDKYGNPYLEGHHIIWLSHGGEDSPRNMVALCPNCHRKMHVVANQEDVKKLMEIAENYGD